jgi:hypothetical protein
MSRRLILCYSEPRAHSTRRLLTLRDHITDYTESCQVTTCSMRVIWLCAIQVCPTQEASRPVSLPRLVVCAKLVVIDWLVRLIQGICSIRSPVVSEARSYADSGSCQQESLSMLLESWRGATEGRSRSGRECGRQEVDKSPDSTRGCARARGDQLRQWQRVGVGDTKEGHCMSTREYL